MLIVSVQRKAKQIGILKSIGARSNQILLVFLLEGLGIAVAGSVMGAIAGIAVVYLLSLRRMTEAGALPLRPHQREFPLWTLPTRRQAGEQVFLPYRAEPLRDAPAGRSNNPCSPGPSLKRIAVKAKPLRGALSRSLDCSKAMRNRALRTLIWTVVIWYDRRSPWTTRRQTDRPIPSFFPRSRSGFNLPRFAPQSPSIRSWFVSTGGSERDSAPAGSGRVGSEGHRPACF